MRWLAEEVRRAHDARGPLRILDVGCGEKPYAPLFAPYAAEHLGVDAVDNPVAELKGPVEALPVEDGSFDVVVCTQVLEHCDDPAQAVRELRRATAPGGVVLASTHGVMVYHPSPQDLWRWTHAGLERLFAAERWAELEVTPASGTAACLGMLLALYLELLLKRTPAAAAVPPAVSLLNRAAAALDARSARLRDPRQPGTLFANLHVRARTS